MALHCYPKAVVQSLLDEIYSCTGWVEEGNALDMNKGSLGYARRTPAKDISTVFLFVCVKGGPEREKLRQSISSSASESESSQSKEITPAVKTQGIESKAPTSTARTPRAKVPKPSNPSPCRLAERSCPGKVSLQQLVLQINNRSSRTPGFRSFHV